MKKRIYYVIVFVLLVGLIVAAWTPKPTLAQTPKSKAKTPSPGEIRIGLNASLSGPAAPWGITYSRCGNKLVEDINKEGGLLVGGKRYLIKLYEYDSKRDPATSVENAKKLIFTDKVIAIMHHGGVITSPTLPVLSENKIISLDISVGPYVLRWPYNFETQAVGRVLSMNGYKTFTKLFGIKKVAEFNPDNDSGYTNEVDDRWAAKQVGVEIISHQFFPEDTTDFYPILTKAIATNPDMLVIGLGVPGNVPVIIKQARELGWKGPIGMTQGAVGAVSTLVKIAGEAAEGFLYSTPCHDDRNFMTEEEKAWMDYFLKRWGEPFVADAFLGYKMFDLYFQGVRKANSLNPDKIAKALETNEFVVLGWKIHFGVTPDCYMGRPRALMFPLPITTIKNGKAKVLELVFPEGVARAR
jgi:branched-chain amino acid transport system substrate-binding protein